MHIKNTKEILSNSFLELAESKRVDKITIKEISQNCGMSSPTFYNHFTDKYDLMLWTYTEFVTKVHDEFIEDELDKMKWGDVLKKSFVFQWEHKGFMLSAMKYTAGQVSFKALITKHSIHDFLEMLEHRKKASLSDNEIFVAKLYIHGISEMNSERILSEDPMGLEEFCEKCCCAIPTVLKEYLTL